MIQPSRPGDIPQMAGLQGKSEFGSDADGEDVYSITSGGAPIVNITQGWVTVRDSYTLDVADGVDPRLALAVLWAFDRWVERD